MPLPNRARRLPSRARKQSVTFVRKRHKYWGIAALSLAAVATSAAANNTCPDRPVRSVSSPSMPADVCIPDGFNDVPVNYFDDFSWRAFLAMVWPAAPGHRGVADANEPVGAAGPRVFETLKSMWEVFHEDGSAPGSDFGAY